eukprot:COSAG06_NODE_33095_length_495_cov_1.121212_2_plen_105_part_00
MLVLLNIAGWVRKCAADTLLPLLLLLGRRCCCCRRRRRCCCCCYFIDYDVMRRHHPEIIYARIKGFGTSGPWSGYLTFDSVAQATSGAFAVTGEDVPMRPVFQF